MHSWLPLIVAGCLIGAIILIVGVAVLIPILRGARPCVEWGTFKLSFDDGKGNSQPEITSGGRQ